ncbi:glycosyltransferase family 9 protein [Endomicrobium proavitum]|uniref:Putative ADP-heptose--lipopolysaccharide heptosyltransferase n=1 Tax=Endomicrobium proavitum TaxID=1408281 RepID=A0A0G3WI79_9BACT|nr:glycosyltransferase family 9 protein [Endomicrobium proavitum]AKL97572.1 putative ADP-heptose--lipopolysaccharide heptosyltransferase [Endomicrobium proavitum]
MKIYFLLKYIFYILLSKLPFGNREKFLGLAGKYLVKLCTKKINVNFSKIKIEDNAVIIALFESLGDIIACEPVARRMKQQYPNRPLYWIIGSQYADVIKYNPCLKSVIKINSVSQWITLKQNLSKSVTIVDLHFRERAYILDRGKVYINDNDPEINSVSKGNSLVDVFSRAARIKPVNDAPMFYRRPKDKQYKFDINEKYIAIHTVSAQWRRDWTIEKWQSLIEQLELILPNIKIVELGLFPSIKKRYKNYIDKTGLKSIQDSADIIAGAHAFIGIDSAMAHLANALNIFGVILMNSGGHMPFSGNYQKGINSKIIVNTNIKDITVEEVLAAVQILCSI